VATNARGSCVVSIPANDARVLTHCPTGSALTQQGNQLRANGVVIDFRLAGLDTDGDKLPDWWESRYYGGPTSAQPQTPGANGFTAWQNFLLGLDPRDPAATFKITQAALSNGQPAIAWTSVGGKRYAVESSSNLVGTDFGFATDAVLLETNAPAGVESRTHFPDSLPPASRTNGARYYRVKLVP
jgi:hypothetical protein